MMRCTKCVFPETLPGITFNEEGICNFCLDYKPIEYLGEDGLLEHIDHAKNQHQEYDCIVPISGGRDSSYVLYVARKKYDLKVLAVNYDNGFRTEQALINMKNACEILDVDFVSVGSERNIDRKILIESIRDSIKYGVEHLEGVICSACGYGHLAVVYLTAEKYNAPLILWGTSQIERTVHLADDYYLSRYRKTPLQKILNPCLKLRYYKFRHRLEFPACGNIFDSLLLRKPKLSKDIRGVNLFDYIPWDRRKIKETIMSELDWRKPEDSVSTWRTDCELASFVTYCFQNIFGCSKHCFGYHNMINEGQITREEALEQEEKTTAIFTHELEELLENDVGLSKKDIDIVRSFQRYPME